MIVLGVDFSGYTPNVTRERIACTRDRFGVEWCTIGLTGNRYFDVQMTETLAAGGVKVDTYVIPRTWFALAAPIVTAQLDRLAAWKGKIQSLVWLDAETLDEPDPPRDLAIQWLWDAIKLCEQRGYEPGIYTSRSMWARLTGNTTEFSRYRLWEAFYGPYRPFVPFGGWGERAGVQWQGSTTLCELNVDLNTWERREATVNDEQVKALIGEVLALNTRTQERVDRLEAQQRVTSELIVDLAEGHPGVAHDKLVKLSAFAGTPYPPPAVLPT